MKSPNLYIMKVTISDGSRILDEYYTQFGIRTVSAKDGKFLLNNKVMFLPGLARHEETSGLWKECTEKYYLF